MVLLTSLIHDFVVLCITFCRESNLLEMAVARFFWWVICLLVQYLLYLISQEMFLCKYQKNMFAFLSRCHNQQPILSRPNAISLICTPYATLKCHYRLTQLTEAKSKNSITLRELKILFLHSALFLYSFKILLPLLILSFADIKEVTLFH